MNTRQQGEKHQEMVSRRRVEIAEMLSAGQSVSAIAKNLSATGDQISSYALYRALRRADLPRRVYRQTASKKIAVIARAREARHDKVQMMVALYRDGYTLAQIAGQYGITRERVRQLMTQDFGVRASHGGETVRLARLREQRLIKAEAKCHKRWGCSLDQYRELQKIDRELIATGTPPYRAPRRAFRSQRNNARHRGIEWGLTLWEWWQIWQQSGKWEQRGRGQGYVMARYGDTGPYAIGNVFVTTAVNNSYDAPRKRKSSLPCGVRKTKNKRPGYVAQRMIGGKIYRSKTYPTAELAHAAYLMLGEQRAAA